MSNFRITLGLCVIALAIAAPFGATDFIQMAGAVITILLITALGRVPSFGRKLFWRASSNETTLPREISLEAATAAAGKSEGAIPVYLAGETAAPIDLTLPFLTNFRSNDVDATLPAPAYAGTTFKLIAGYATIDARAFVLPKHLLAPGPADTAFLENIDPLGRIR